APGADPRRWMPLPTPVERGGRRAVQVAPAKHAGSHLSGVAFRGWEFLGHGRGDRVEAVRTALHRAGPDGLVHLHVDDVDHAGHRHGVDSEQWRTALAEVDSLMGTLLRRLPAGTRIHVTADHGMVDTSPQHTIDLAEHPRLLRLIDQVAGEARALALHTVPGEGAAVELAEGLTRLLGERALVLRRAQVLAEGLLGPVGAAVPARVAPRSPDVLAPARGRRATDDFSRPPEPAGPPNGVPCPVPPACCRCRAAGGPSTPSRALPTRRGGCSASAARSPPRRRGCRGRAPRPEPRRTERLDRASRRAVQSCFEPKTISSQLGIEARLLRGRDFFAGFGSSGSSASVGVPSSVSAKPGSGVRSTVSWGRWEAAGARGAAPAADAG